MTVKPTTVPALGPPHLQAFVPHENPGAGDCFYLSVAQGLAILNGQKIKPKEFEAGGVMQAQVRILASKEVKKYPADYQTTVGIDDHQTIKASPSYAESNAVKATANACHLDIRIWLKDKHGLWSLYRIPPTRGDAEKIIWLELQHEHYRLLTPRGGGLDPEQEKTWLANARETPTSLKGRGKGPQLNASALRLLGLRAPSVASCSSARSLDSAMARDILGLPRPASTAPSRGSARTKATSKTSRPHVKALPKAKAKASPKHSNKRHPPRKPAPSRATTADQDDDDELSTPSAANFGKHLHCPTPNCGWKPDTRRRSNLWRTDACKHWRRCRGELPPRAPENHHVYRSKALAAHYATARTNASHRKWHVWLAALPAATKAATCKPDLDTPTMRYFTKNQQLNYTCTKCSRSTSLRKFKELPCMKRAPGSLSLTAFRLSTLPDGAEVNRKHYAARADWRRRTAAAAKAKANPKAKAKAKVKPTL